MANLWKRPSVLMEQAQSTPYLHIRICGSGPPNAVMIARAAENAVTVLPTSFCSIPPGSDWATVGAHGVSFLYHRTNVTTLRQWYRPRALFLLNSGANVIHHRPTSSAVHEGPTDNGCGEGASRLTEYFSSSFCSICSRW